jgi:hypothetical protein
MMIGPVHTGSSSARGSLVVIVLLLGRRRLDVYMCLLRIIRIVLFFVCPSFSFLPLEVVGTLKLDVRCRGGVANQEGG